MANFLEARFRHTRYYENLLRSYNHCYLEGNGDVANVLMLFDDEWENIRAGQQWASTRAENEAAQLCIGYASAGASLLELRQHPKERIDWLENGLAAARRLNWRASESSVWGDRGRE
jgi:hypothetical protein